MNDLENRPQDAGVVTDDKRAATAGFFQALFRTRTGDTLLTMEVPEHHWRSLPSFCVALIPAHELFLSRFDVTRVN